MREAFELGWATTCVHIKSRPTIVCMDDINFQKPVEVGSLLYLSSQVSNLNTYDVKHIQPL